MKLYINRLIQVIPKLKSALFEKKSLNINLIDLVQTQHNPYLEHEISEKKITKL